MLTLPRITRLRCVSLCLVILPLLWPARWAAAEQLPEQAVIRKVIDGDTIELKDGTQVRYIGIDAPEVYRPAHPGDREWRAPQQGYEEGRGQGSAEQWVLDPEPYGQAATEANRHLVSGKRVTLEYDMQHYDKYGRLLAYVSVDDVMVNKELVEQGFAQPLTIPPNTKHAGEFRELVEEARQQHRGLWRSAR